MHLSAVHFGTQHIGIGACFGNARAESKTGTFVRLRRFSSMKIRVIVNNQAGTVLGVAHEELMRQIETPFRDVGHDVSLDVVAPDDLTAHIEDAALGDADAVIIGGGDGSIRTAAADLMGTSKALGVLPLGTMNLLARDLGIPMKIDAAAKALASAEVSTIDVARVNDRIFLCASVMGLVTQYSAERQRLRGRPWPRRVLGYVAAIRRLLSGRHRIAIAIDDGRDVNRFRALSVAVCSNEYDATTGLMLRRSQLDQQSLTLYSSRHRSGWSMAFAVARLLLGPGLLLGRWPDDPRLSRQRARRFTISTRAKRVWLANDGEIEVLTTPLIYTVEPGALRVLRPRTVEASAEDETAAGTTFGASTQRLAAFV